METVKKVIAWWKLLSVKAKVGLVALVVGTGAAVAVVSNIDSVVDLADEMTTKE